MIVKEYKREGALIKNQQFRMKKGMSHLMKLMRQNKTEGLMRVGNFSTEVIWGGNSYVFPNKGYKKFVKGLFLFGMVRNNARAFVKSGKKLKMPKNNPVNVTNNDFDQFEKPLTGTDINHAYWRIAYNLGIITKNTYEKGLDEDLKSVRLAALSTLGAGKMYSVVRGGKPTGEMVKIGGDEALSQLYKIIRFTCFSYMAAMRKKLGDDFAAYRTDCIYYVDTPENRQMVRKYFESKDMSVKQLYRVRGIKLDKDETD